MPFPASALLSTAILFMATPSLAHMGDDQFGSGETAGSPPQRIYEPVGPFSWGERNTDFAPAFDGQFRAQIEASRQGFDVRVLADGLNHPWGVAVLPDGNGYLVTEQSGHLHHLTEDGRLSAPIEGVAEVVFVEQGGLLDVAIGPDFAQDRMIYFTYSKPMGEGPGGSMLNATAAARGVLSQDLSALSDVEDIFVQDPPSESPMHYGSRIVFDGAGHAFITTGEHFTMEERDYAQDLDKTYGKVIRVNLDGTIPEDNPFVDDPNAAGEIWSLGHRNIQGAAVDSDGTLWAIEHGPKGGDELNRPEPGKNYGWPFVSYGLQYDGQVVGIGEASREGFEQPVYFWDPVIAPGGMDFHSGETFSEWNGDLLIGSYIRKGVVRLIIGDDGLVQGEERFLSELGRVQDVEVLDDGSFLLLTDKENGEVIHVTPAN